MCLAWCTTSDLRADVPRCDCAPVRSAHIPAKAGCGCLGHPPPFRTPSAHSCFVGTFSARAEMNAVIHAQITSLLVDVGYLAPIGQLPQWRLSPAVHNQITCGLAACGYFSGPLEPVLSALQAVPTHPPQLPPRLPTHPPRLPPRLPWMRPTRPRPVPPGLVPPRLVPPRPVPPGPVLPRPRPPVHPRQPLHPPPQQCLPPAKRPHR